VSIWFPRFSLIPNASTWPRRTSCSRISRSMRSRVATAAARDSESTSNRQIIGPCMPPGPRMPTMTGVPSGAVVGTRPSCTASVTSSGPIDAVAKSTAPSS
jgi:hypothetical protein